MAITWQQSIDATNDWVAQTFYDGASQGEGIDLRIELQRILYGGFGQVPKGHWVVLRQYDRSNPSDSYNKRTHEGVGGPAYQYTDTILRTRRVPTGKRSDDLSAIKAGMNLLDMFTYYFEYHINPRVGDDIFELELNDHTNMPTNPTFSQKWHIKRVHPYRLEQGNVQYWMAVAEYDEIRY